MNIENRAAKNDIGPFIIALLLAGIIFGFLGFYHSKLAAQQQPNVTQQVTTTGAGLFEPTLDQSTARTASSLQALKLQLMKQREALRNE